MKRFDALDHSLSIHQHYLLEASAGTGKTFSIENLVTRLLIEPDSNDQVLQLGEILIVTFTRFATRDLKMRIRAQLIRAIESLKEPQPDMPGYLKQILDTELAIRRLSEALFTFDQAQIYTIHGFCGRMLREYSMEADVCTTGVYQESGISKELLERLFLDFVNLRMTANDYDAAEIKAAVKAAGKFSSVKSFQKKLLDVAVQHVQIDDQGETSSPTVLFAKLARAFQGFVRTYMEQHEIIASDSLLQNMAKASKNPTFCQHVRKRYRAAIVDEFQDTDPLQWDIFHQLFIEQGCYAGHLYLVGDPKQSIYGFRQADIYTYLAAVDALGHDARATLDTNYRSHPRLVEAMNTLFQHAGNWLTLPRTGQTLPFVSVKAGLSETSPLIEDGKGSIHFFVGHSPKKSCRTRKSALKSAEQAYFYPYIADEIRMLKERHGVGFRQCAVLVKDRYQAQKIVKELELLNIPAVFQRSGYLSDGPACEAWMGIIRAVLNPTNLSDIKLALAGLVFQWSTCDIRSIRALDQWRPILQQFQRLNQLLEEQGFIVFMRALFSLKLHPTLLSVGERLLQSVHGRELYQDLSQIGDFLGMEMENQGVLPEGLLALLEQLPLLAANDDVRVKRYRDLQVDAVQVLTMHASKGLEFDVVFALGLVAAEEAPDLLMRHHNTLLPVQKKGDLRYQKACEEVDAEKLRQLYVVLTRAKHRMYVPIMKQETKLACEWGSASPLELFMGYLAQPQGAYTDIYNAIAGGLEVVIEKLKQIDTGITLEVLDALPNKGMYQYNEPPVELVSPPQVTVPGVERFVVSYSSLAKPHTSESVEAVPQDYNVEERTPHTLPAGNVTGLILHSILEKIPFELGKDSVALKQFVKTALNGTPFQGWLDTFVEIVSQTLNVPLESGFAINSIHPLKMWREHEFMLPSDAGLCLGDRPIPPGFLKGVIDLVFEHEGRYYLIDWKSNWLGSTVNHYGVEQMQKAMIQNDYYLQASVYKEALRRFLTLVDPRPFDEIFGGCYYIFLRGVSDKTGILNVARGDNNFNTEAQRHREARRVVIS